MIIFLFVFVFCLWFIGKKLSNGKALSGEGRLTTRVDTFQSFYGPAPRKNKGDCEKMSRPALAILDHYSENATPEKCLEAQGSWCSFNQNKATGRSSHYLSKIFFLQLLWKCWNKFSINSEARTFSCLWKCTQAKSKRMSSPCCLFIDSQGSILFGLWK